MSQISAEFSLSSATIDAFLWLYATGSPGGQTLALHDNIDATNTDANLRILMSPDSYVVGANTPPPAETGTYTLTSTIVPANNTDCAEVWVTPAVTTTQALETTDCATADPTYSDEFSIVLLFGDNLTVTMASGAVNPRLVILDSERMLLAEDPGNPTATLSFTAPANDAYIIVATSDNASETGAYTLTVEVGI